ncbi:hypothetical protein PENSPDRAFT_614853 [Peniophora sp. CONT]|nr:hypothetical protein PENSPDRAFT_614853 [Peniophora sp. CONT]
MNMDHELDGDVHPDGVEHYFPDPPDDLTGGLPVNLDSLRDGPPGSKPFYPYSTLIRYAIKGSPNQKLLLEDIYYAIESRFPYFRTASSGWKNSVRHNLSLNPCFEKVPRPLTDRGKGSYWTVNETVDPRTGVHRVRAPKNAAPTEGGAENGEIQPSTSAGPKRRGRKAKSKATSNSPEEFNPDRHFVDGAPSFVPPTLGAGMGAGPSSDAGGFPGFPPGAFDQPPPGPPPFMLMPPVPPVPDLPIDAAGNVDWHSAWLRELDSLRVATGEAENHGAGQDWYREMLLKVRTGMLMQIVPPAGPPPPEAQSGLPQQPE